MSDGLIFANAQPAVVDTGAAKLPALPSIQTGNQELDNFLGLMKERLEVREGDRGNPWEKAVTRRDIRELEDMLQTLKTDKSGDGSGVVVEFGGGLTASVAIDRFIASIKELPVYKDLMKRLDDPSRFDNLPAEVRNLVKESVADEAAKLGTSIMRTETILKEANRQLAMQINRVYAAVQGASAGVRRTEFALAETDFAQAAIIQQLEASLGNYYQDGTPGRALLEEQMTVTADRIAGLSSQWTLKVQAGKAIAGIGLAATEDGAGNTTSAFIVAADKFAIVDPNTYTTGLTNTPDMAHIPFGVDANGIYMNTNVYIRGNIRVDTSGKTLIDGMRGSLNIGISGYWSDTAARNAVYQQLGKGTSAPNNNHLVIGDSVTMSVGSTATTRFWNGTGWSSPGMVLNGDLLVNGSVAAQKINTNGLDIRDTNGNVIFSSGVNLSVSRISGLGAMATANDARIGSTVRFPDGSLMNTWDFVSRLGKISGGNIDTFMENAAIGNAYIGNLAVSTLKIQDHAVTQPWAAVLNHVLQGAGNLNWMTYMSATYQTQYNEALLITATLNTGTDGTGWREMGVRLLVDGSEILHKAADEGMLSTTINHVALKGPGLNVSVQLQFYGRDSGARAQGGAITILGVRK